MLVRILPKVTDHVIDWCHAHGTMVLLLEGNRRDNLAPGRPTAPEGGEGVDDSALEGGTT